MPPGFAEAEDMSSMPQWNAVCIDPPCHFALAIAERCSASAHRSMPRHSSILAAAGSRGQMNTCQPMMVKHLTRKVQAMPPLPQYAETLRNSVIRILCSSILVP